MSDYFNALAEALSDFFEEYFYLFPVIIVSSAVATFITFVRIFCNCFHFFDSEDCDDSSDSEDSDDISESDSFDYSDYDHKNFNW